MTSKAPIKKITGSCACGKVRFTAAPNPTQVTYCYCTTCRKQSGAPYIPFAHFRNDEIEWHSKPDEFRKSDVAVRYFCSQCGSTISMTYSTDPTAMGIAVGCIDEGQELIGGPEKCIFVEEKPAWAKLPEGVPAFSKFDQEPGK